ncbi:MULTISPECIES: hypothetical protein [Myxococcus]|uniref:Lipoprotein n=1 Tax=Myxococcus llanfairpwllgwyngyllgogerychwyrndrobwllllantysiliogogogochensis TaxID=2590453 RepID=A0A540WLL1_9BACT|nr:MULTISPECIES: hypothetical protein [Myxococcus]NTX04422.1 hypothetical protein [Myxococcus sp. CA040A]NTX36588.1 hypothetical protein [Myxococcus sp. CA033]TQF09899.1 hypothetical protein FJV41_42280 [Myxococcus llanfairpwllgwyngyllgogerychwyrndrobwllllantysiliogogogochensis]
MKRVFVLCVALFSVSWLGCGGPLAEEGGEPLSQEPTQESSQELVTCPGDLPQCSTYEGKRCIRRVDCCDGDFLLWCACDPTMKRFHCL